MSLLRAAGRTMLASFFVVQGAKTALKPDQFVDDAKPVAEKVVPLVKRVAPPTVAAFVPEDTKSLVRYSGIAQVVGGAGLATGIGRRGGAALLATSMVPHVMASLPKKGATAEERSTARAVLMRNVALLGAALIAAEDTQGKPSLMWRANQQGQRLRSAVDSQAKQLSKQQSRTQKKLEKKANTVAKQAKRQYGGVSKQLSSALS